MPHIYDIIKAKELLKTRKKLPERQEKRDPLAKTSNLHSLYPVASFSHTCILENEGNSKKLKIIREKSFCHKRKIIWTK
jgi:hypothetical protein